MSQNLIPSLIKDVKPGAESSNPTDLIGVNDNLFFLTSDQKFLKSDGTAAGTVEVNLDPFFEKNFENGAVTELFTGIGDRLFFSGKVSPSLTSLGLIIGSTDGTELGTSELSLLPIFFGTSGGTNSSVTDFETLKGNFAFVTQTANFQNFSQTIITTTELFINDKSSILRLESTDNPLITELTDVNGTLFFAAGIGVANQLFKSDGTEVGTTTIGGSNLNSVGLTNLTNVNGTLFFSGETKESFFDVETKEFVNIQNGVELFKSDGTSEGTVVIKDINPGEASSNPDKITDVNGTAFFTADDGINGTELWKSDGTQSGTSLVKDIVPGSEGSNADNLTNVNGTLFFTVNDATNGTELWKSDGTESGTVLIEDINPGANSSNPENLTAIDGILYFSADDGSNGREVWKSDGTELGTVLAGDINPGSASSNPEDFTELNGEIFFSADDDVNGRELWGLTEGGTQPNQNLILGGDSNDVLSGDEQDNIIDGLKGDDTLTGGSGKDKFVLSGDFGSDVITDFTLGEDEIINATDNIVLTVASVGDAVNVAFSNTGDVLQVNLNDNEQAGLENYLLNLGSSQTLPY